MRLSTGEGDEAVVVRAWEVSAETLTEEWVAEVCEVAQADCDSRAVTTVYALQLCDESGPLATTTLRLRPSETALEGVEEPPTMQGLVQQLMRHIESQARQNALLMMQSQAALAKQTEALNSILETQTRLLEAATRRAMEAEERAAAASEEQENPAFGRLLDVVEKHFLGSGENEQ